MITINTLLLKKLTSENFTVRLTQANLLSKNDIVNFVKRHFHNKLKSLNRNYTSNKIELNELSERVKAILTNEILDK